MICLCAPEAGNCVLSAVADIVPTKVLWKDLGVSPGNSTDSRCTAVPSVTQVVEPGTNE